jgi:hypothetical protein
MADSADSTHPFVYPYGFIVFWLNLEFIDALTFCQDSDMDVMDFQFYGFNYIAVFSFHDFFHLTFYCDDNAFHFVKFLLS